MCCNLVVDLISQLGISIISVGLTAGFGYYIYHVKQKQKIEKILAVEICILDDTVKLLLENIKKVKSDCCKNNIQTKLLELTGQMPYIMLQTTMSTGNVFFLSFKEIMYVCLLIHEIQTFNVVMNNVQSLVKSTSNKILLENKNNTLERIKEQCNKLNKTISRTTCLPWYEKSIQDIKPHNLK